jgi:alkanesulfonate monooxygenase SsuD/methylene tetrahydromethanopterin reductase-like flavin-dependent oxidoreductase (luciferase family)
MDGELGATLHTGDMSMDDLLRYAREAEALAFDGFWLLEESGKESFAVLALLARETQRLRLGTSILSYYTRTPTLLAMGASTIQRLSGGRLALGLGPGGLGFVERGHGIAPERPRRRARETVEIVRGLLPRPRLSYEGEIFHVRDFRLREGPLDAPPPIYLAALNPRMVVVAAGVADGLISNLLTEESLHEIQALVRQGAEAAGRDPGRVKILTLLLTCPDPSDASAVNAMRRGVAFYCAAASYHHIADVSGFGAAVRRVYDVWVTGDFAGATRLVTDAMIEKFSLTGSRAACQAKLRWMLDAGVYPLVYPIPRRERMVEDHFAAIRLVASYLS